MLLYFQLVFLYGLSSPGFIIGLYLLKSNSFLLYFLYIFFFPPFSFPLHLFLSIHQCFLRSCSLHVSSFLHIFAVSFLLFSCILLFYLCFLLVFSWVLCFLSSFFHFDDFHSYPLSSVFFPLQPCAIFSSSCFALLLLNLFLH